MAFNISSLISDLGGPETLRQYTDTNVSVDHAVIAARVPAMERRGDGVTTQVGEIELYMSSDIGTRPDDHDWYLLENGIERYQVYRVKIFAPDGIDEAYILSLRRTP